MRLRNFTSVCFTQQQKKRILAYLILPDEIRHFDADFKRQISGSTETLSEKCCVELLITWRSIFHTSIHKS